MSMNFEEVHRKVENSYPFFIVSVIHRYISTNRKDLGSRHKIIIDLFESIVRFLTVVQLLEMQQSYPNLKDFLPEKEKTLEFLKRPSLGGWIGLIRTLSTLDIGKEKPFWSNRISNWYLEVLNTENKVVFEKLKTLQAFRYNTKSRTPHAEMCNALVNYRNKQLAHAANLSEVELNERLPILEEIVAYMLQSLSFMGQMEPFYIEGVELAENNRWLIRGERLVGTNSEPIEYLSENQPELHEVYLTIQSNGLLSNEPVPLTPFILWQYNEDIKQNDVYYYNDAWRTKLEYLSFSSGTYYYHQELHSKFNEFLTLKISPGKEEDEYIHLSQDERSVRAEELFKRANLWIHQGKQEDAIECLEQAAAYERRAEIFLLMGEAQIELGDAPEAIRRTIQSCLELEPSNVKANQILESLDDGYDNIESQLEERDEVKVMEFPTFPHAFTPAKLRSYSSLWWFSMLSLWFGFAAVAENLAGHSKAQYLALIGIFICCVIFTQGLIIARLILLRLRLPLSLQLDTMRLSRFNQWYDEQLKIIFGSYVFNNGHLDIVNSIKKEPKFYLFGLVWIVAIEVPILFVTQTFIEPLFLVIVRVINYTLLLGVLYPCLLYVVLTTQLIVQYSRNSLKPVLSKINDEGIRSFGSLMTFNLSLATIANASYWLLAGLNTHVGSLWLDAPVLFIITLIVLVWSIGMPASIHYAARSAKTKAVHEYASHIEQSFRKFLENPDQERVDRYDWLVKNQKIIQNISTWPISIIQTFLIVFGSNIILFFVVVWFIINRI